MESFDCAVIGAGWHGLAAAKQLHCTRPDDSLVVLESQSSLGGTWAEERLYPLLKSNNLKGTYEYPDFPMDSDRFGVKHGQHIPGEVVHTYLKAYAEHFGMTGFIRLENKVQVAEHQENAEGGWILTVASPQRGEYKIFVRRLVLATGLTSEPFMPHFDGQESFGGRIFHSKDFRQNRDTLETAKSVTVFGGTKFAWDAVYAYATAGVAVDWVIRSSGHGPCWISPSYVTPFKKWIEKLANVRALSWFSPCIWGDSDGYSGIRNFLHRTAIGRVIVNVFWSILGGDVMSLNAYDSHPKTAKLKPWVPAMFAATSFSIRNYDTDIFELVRNNDRIRIHIGDIDHLSLGKVHLSDGSELESDALLANTGWKNVPPVKFLPEGIEKELGLPHRIVEKSHLNDLLKQADRDILTRFPRLRDQPVWNKNYVPLTDQKGITSNDEVTTCTPLTPFILHHFIVPPSERFLRARDVAFVGMVSNFSNIITAHLQGLWISAYFSGLLANDPSKAVSDEKSLQELKYEAVLQNRFGKWRYPTEGHKAPSFIFDAVPYLDVLVHDLGLRRHRKGDFWNEMWDPYGPEDYADVNDEWQRKYGAKLIP